MLEAISPLRYIAVGFALVKRKAWCSVLITERKRSELRWSLYIRESICNVHLPETQQSLSSSRQSPLFSAFRNNLRPQPPAFSEQHDPEKPIHHGSKHSSTILDPLARSARSHRAEPDETNASTRWEKPRRCTHNFRNGTPTMKQSSLFRIH